MFHDQIPNNLAQGIWLKLTKRNMAPYSRIRYIGSDSDNPRLCPHLFRVGAGRSDEQEYAASAIAILEMFGLTDTAENLVGGNVNKHFNVLTMAENLHWLFDRMEFWFEAVIGEASKLSIYF
ncbi:hypothetical protein B0H10DRAFT_1939634 [Mycena sp. CBHHK59/15]|nr:hypothetical protein B0H10DRAFT_1939634 [Mycena sp. CBHHK59/15]